MENEADIGAENYRRLLTKVAQAWSLDEGKFLAEQSLEMEEGVTLSFEHLPQTNLCRIGLPLGRMPDDTDALKIMLESNAFPEKGLLPVLALDPESGEPIVFMHFPAIEGAEVALHGFLELGSVVAREQWKEMWKEGWDQSPPSMSALA